MGGMIHGVLYTCMQHNATECEGVIETVCEAVT